MCAAGCSLGSDETVSTAKSFRQDSNEAIVIAAVRIDLPAKSVLDVQGDNTLGLSYGITWSKYDPDTDARAGDRTQDFAVSIGLDTEGVRSCKLVDAWQYCIHDVEPGFYVLASASVAQERAEMRRGRAIRQTFVAERTSLGVGKGFGGVNQIADTIPISKSGAQRFKIRQGKVYYIGGYTLSPYAQILDVEFDVRRARQLLAEYPGIEADVVAPVQIQPYRLRLRTGFCPGLHWVEPQTAEFTTDNPCAEAE